MKRFGQSVEFWIATLFVLGAPGCRSAPGNAYNLSSPADSETAPVHFEPCPTPRGTLPNAVRSYAAMLRSLTDLKWRIESTSPTFDRIVGFACLGVDAELCVTMHFDVENSQGGFIAYAPDDKPIVNKMAGHVTRWMHFLDQKYTNYRCFDDTMAVEQLRLFGLSPAAPTAGDTPQSAPQSPPVSNISDTPPTAQAAGEPAEASPIPPPEAQ